MNMSGIERQGDLMYQFNGMIEREEAFGLELYETPFRSYDAQLGRFWQVEPLADIYVGVSMYQFAYNNPVSFNDPTGLRADPPRPYYNPFEAIGIRPMHQGNRGFPSYGDRGSRETGIDLSDLRAGDPIGATRLVKDLQDFTGLASLHINKKGFLDYDRGYWWGRLLGFNKIKNPSAIARRELIRAIKSKSIIQVLNNYDGIGGQGHKSVTIPGTNTIYYDREAVEGIISKPSQGFSLNPLKMRTMGYAITLLHELWHTVEMGELNDEARYDGDVLGSIVPKINKIRSQMNLPLRNPYAQVPFPKEIIIQGNRIPVFEDFLGFDPITSKILNEFEYGTYPQDGADRFFFITPGKYANIGNMD